MRKQMSNIVCRLFFLVVLVCNPLFCACLYGDTSQVKVVKGSQLKRIIKENPVVVVEFFAEWCGHCQAFAPEYEKAAKSLKGIIPFVAVDDQSEMAEYGIQGFPTIKIFLESSTKPKDYSGPRTAEGLLNASLSAIKDVSNWRLKGKTTNKKENKKKPTQSSVIDLSDDNFDNLVTKDTEHSWFIKFYAPWCGHCKSLAPEWEELSSLAQDRIKIAEVDATKHTMLAHRYKIKGFPTILMFPAGMKGKDPIPYNGPRTASDMLEFGLKFQSKSVSVKQLTSQKILENSCSKGLCVIAFLPHILDSSDSEREKYLNIYKDVILASATLSIRFLWSEGGSQFDFEEKLNLAFGYPATVAINMEKQRFSTHRGSFTVESLNSFLIELTTGRAPVDPLPKLPYIKDVEEWKSKKTQNQNSDGQKPHSDEL